MKLVKSPLNYTGGKYRLLQQILPYFPTEINSFFDIFCGGANVGVNIEAKHSVYNDSNIKVIGLLKTFYSFETSRLIGRIEEIINRYELSESSKNGYLYYGTNSSPGLASYNKDRYLKMREDFNERAVFDDEYYIHLYVLVMFSFNNQMRFNRIGKYNLPVGKRDFNATLKAHLEKFCFTIKEQEAAFCSQDFSHFNTFRSDDFVYADPPYLISTASYNEQNAWTYEDEQRLLGYLDSLSAQGVRFALSNVLRHKGRENSILIGWLRRSNYRVIPLDYSYHNASYHSKNCDRPTEEVLITNY